MEAIPALRQARNEDLITKSYKQVRNKGKMSFLQVYLHITHMHITDIALVTYTKQGQYELHVGAQERHKEFLIMRYFSNFMSKVCLSIFYCCVT